MLGLEPPRMLRKLSVSLVTLVVLFCGAELVIRLFEPGPFSLFDTNPYIEHESLHHVHRPNFEGRWDGTWYETNSLGLRGPELPPVEELEAHFTIAALGDSCTFGKGVVESATWPRQLERSLYEELPAGRIPTVANLGVNGYAVNAYLEVLRDMGPAIGPDVVVLGFNLNDFPNVIKKVDKAVFQGKKTLRASMPRWLRDGIGQLAIGRWARATYYELNESRDRANAERLAAQTQEASPENAERLERAREQLESLFDEAREQGAEMAVFLFPYESQVYQESFNDQPVRWIERVCAEEEVLFVDVLTPFRERARDPEAADLFLRGDRYHPSPLGYEIVADAVLLALRDAGWLP